MPEEISDGRLYLFFSLLLMDERFAVWFQQTISPNHFSTYWNNVPSIIVCSATQSPDIVAENWEGGGLDRVMCSREGKMLWLISELFLDQQEYQITVEARFPNTELTKKLCIKGVLSFKKIIILVYKNTFCFCKDRPYEIGCFFFLALTLRNSYLCFYVYVSAISLLDALLYT